MTRIRLANIIISLLLVLALVVFLVIVILPSAPPAGDDSDLNGSELWHKTYDGGHWDAALDVAADSEGNIVVAGASQRWHDYNDNGEQDPGELNGDYYTIKYDPAGNELWSRAYDGGHWDYAYGVAVDSGDNIVVTGAYEKWQDYNDNGEEDPGEVNYDYWTMKYDAAGNELWGKTYDSEHGDDQAFAVAVDSQDNMVVTGYSSDGSTDNYYTIKYNPDGRKLWSKTYDGGDVDHANSVAVDSEDNVIVTGYSSDGETLNYCTVKYDKDSTEVWDEPVTYDGGYEDGALEVVVDSEDNIVVTGGSSDGTISNYYTVKYAPNGNIFTGWPVTYDSGYKDTAFGAAVDSEDNIIVTGSYSIPPPEGSWFPIWNRYHTIKYNPSGAEITNGWPAIYDGDDEEVVYDVAVDSDGNVIVTGKAFDGATWNYYTIKYGVAAAH